MIFAQKYLFLIFGRITNQLILISFDNNIFFQQLRYFSNYIYAYVS
jgi:hypothetical protein